MHNGRISPISDQDGAPGVLTQGSLFNTKLGRRVDVCIWLTTGEGIVDSRKRDWHRRSAGRALQLVKRPLLQPGIGGGEQTR